jgi:rhodanese-related sulfurtransferase
MHGARRLLAVSVLVLLLGLTACGSSDQGPASSVAPSTSPSGEPATATTAAPTTSAVVSTTAAGRSYTTVDVQTAYEQLSENEEAQLVDVREPAEWESTGVPPGALLIPLGDIEQRAPTELAKDKPLYVICRSGNRSRAASETLIGLGYTEVYNVEGGIQAWIAAGLPVEPYRP